MFIDITPINPQSVEYKLSGMNVNRLGDDDGGFGSMGHDAGDSNSGYGGNDGGYGYNAGWEGQFADRGYTGYDAQGGYGSGGRGGYSGISPETAFRAVDMFNMNNLRNVEEIEDVRGWLSAVTRGSALAGLLGYTNPVGASMNGFLGLMNQGLGLASRSIDTDFASNMASFAQNPSQSSDYGNDLASAGLGIGGGMNALGMAAPSGFGTPGSYGGQAQSFAGVDMGGNGNESMNAMAKPFSYNPRVTPFRSYFDRRA